VTVLGTMVALAGVVLVLHLNEKVRVLILVLGFGLMARIFADWSGF
jgi:hypothetical protein